MFLQLPIRKTAKLPADLEGMAPTLSAFAARRAALPAQISSRSSPNPLHIAAGSAQDEEHEKDITPPKKKRRTQKVTDPTRNAAPTERNERDSAFNTTQSEAPMVALEPALASAEASDLIHQEPLSADMGSDPEAPDPAFDTIRQLCNVIPSQQNIILETESDLSIRISGNNTLALIGQYDLWIRKGAISIYGAVLHASSKLYRVYAPSTHALPLIKSIANPYGSHGQSAEITIKTFFSKLQKLKGISPSFGRIGAAPASYMESTARISKRSFAVMRTSSDDPYQRSLHSLDPPGNWQALTSKILSKDWTEEVPVVLVCGPKGAGKSTFCRILTNAMLTKPGRNEHMTTPNDSENPEKPEKPSIHLLDLDPGQPEFCLPGELSLVKLDTCNIGVPFTHPELVRRTRHQKLRRHFLGSTTPKDDTAHYLDCALDLIKHTSYPLDWGGPTPVIVNCPGWVQGAGLEVLLQLIRRLGIASNQGQRTLGGCNTITDVVYMSDSGPEDVVKALSAECSNIEIPLHMLASQPMNVSTRTAAELRMMQTQSYFHLEEPEAGNLLWNSQPLMGRPPLVVHYSGPKQCIFAVMILGDEQNPRYFETILNGCIVDIVIIEGEKEGVPNIPGTASLWPCNGEDEPVDEYPPGEKDTPTFSFHPLIRRSPTRIPYLPVMERVVRPLSPTRTSSLGQALIRSIDTQNYAFHLLTPIPVSILQHQKQKGNRILLVRGKLDTPTWAYREPLELETSQRRRREREFGMKEEIDDDELKAFAEKTPWTSVVEGKRGTGARKRSGRRDLKYRSQAEGE